MLEYLINPVTACFCFAVAVIRFRRDRVTVGQSLMFFLRRAALNFKTRITEVFTPPGIGLLVVGLLLMFLSLMFF